MRLWSSGGSISRWRWRWPGCEACEGSAGWEDDLSCGVRSLGSLNPIEESLKNPVKILF